jgi:hypothetical protein
MLSQAETITFAVAHTPRNIISPSEFLAVSEIVCIFAGFD